MCSGGPTGTSTTTLGARTRVSATPVVAADADALLSRVAKTATMAARKGSSQRLLVASWLAVVMGSIIAAASAAVLLDTVRDVDRVHQPVRCGQGGVPLRVPQ